MRSKQALEIGPPGRLGSRQHGAQIDCADGHCRITSLTHNRRSCNSVTASERIRKNCDLPWRRG